MLLRSLTEKDNWSQMQGVGNRHKATQAQVTEEVPGGCSKDDKKYKRAGQRSQV